MGYTTWFTGSFSFDKPVTNGLVQYINKFAEVRHMKRDVEAIKANYPNWKWDCFLGDLGTDGEYFVGGNECITSYTAGGVIDHNRPGGSCPGLWCQWIIDDNGELVWDENEKFYEYVEWLEYLIKHFFEPCGYVLNGEVEFKGEDDDDFGTIKVKDNVVEVKYGIRYIDMSEIDTDALIKELQSRGYTVQN